MDDIIDDEVALTIKQLEADDAIVAAIESGALPDEGAGEPCLEDLLVCQALDSMLITAA